MDGSKRKRFPVLWLVIEIVLIALFVAVNVVVAYFSGYFDNMYTVYEAAGGQSVAEVTYDRAIADGNAVSEDILEEGSVMLKNENGVLPLKGNKVNLFGWRSSCMVFGGAGSGFVDESNAVSLKTALNEKGVEVNDDLLDAYTEFSSNGNASGVGETDFDVTEPGADFYTDDVIAHAKEFSDTAIVTVSRMGGEGNDLPRDMAGYVNGSAGKHYLELTDAERNMIELVCDEFENVILLVNSSHAMELGFVDEYDIDSVLWIGCPGTNGLRGVANVLTGAVAPSGRLADTYAYDLTQAPSYANFGEYEYTNADGVYYVNYMEGIYVGYKYYETRAAAYDGPVAALGERTYDSGEAWYDATVQYPFGYGISYTTFDQRISSFVEAGGRVVMQVEVENTGDVAAKDVVQVYYTPEYTEGGVEKAHVNLIGFAKTDVIEPDDVATVDIAFDLEDMASYDMSGNGSYVLDAGDYEIKLMDNAHDVIETRTVSVGERITYSGENKRESDLIAAENRFDDAAVRFTEGHDYLTRSDWNGSWPNASNAESTISDADLATVNGGTAGGYVLETDPNLEHYADESIVTDHELTDAEVAEIDAALREALADDPDALDELDAVSDATEIADGNSELQNAYIKLMNDNKLVFALMGNFDYDSEVWDMLISQMSLQEISDLVSMGGYRTAPVESIEKSVTMDIDGPAGMQPFLSFGIDIAEGVGFPTEAVLAATWNTELARRMGIAVGEFANTQNVSGWYAPAMNIHRSPFGGRNFEYYSEDGFLSGKLGAAEVTGVRAMGVWVYLKHYALNDQELHREGICTFASEQAIREIYLKPFELSVKEGSATGVMSSFNRIGFTWTGGSYALCTEVLRNEWGFRGTVITDFYMNFGGNSANVSARQGLLAGNDLYLNTFQHVAVTTDMLLESDRLAQAAVNSCKNILYMTSRGRLVDLVEVSSWRTLWIVGNVIGGVLIAACTALLVLGIVKYVKGKKVDK